DARDAPADEVFAEVEGRTTAGRVDSGSPRRSSLIRLPLPVIRRPPRRGCLYRAAADNWRASSVLDVPQRVLANVRFETVQVPRSFPPADHAPPPAGALRPARVGQPVAPSSASVAPAGRIPRQCWHSGSIAPTAAGPA